MSMKTVFCFSDCLKRGGAAVWCVAGGVVFLAAFLTDGAASEEREFTIDLFNHHDFPVRQPVQVRASLSPLGAWQTDAKQPVQVTQDGAVLIADLPGNGHQRVNLRPGITRAVEPQLILSPGEDSVSLRWHGREWGRLAWDLRVRPADLDKATDEKIRSAPPDDFAADFEPLPLTFQQVETGPVFDTWTAVATKAGLRLRIELRAYREGFLDLDSQLVNESADPRRKVYAAVVTRWEHPPAAERTLCYDNHIIPFGDRDWSPFRRGSGRHQFTQCGVDWLRLDLAAAGSVVWLQDFAPSFTVRDASARNRFKQPRDQGANLPQLGQEAQTAGPSLYNITEIARANIRSYRDRLADNILPPRGGSVTFSSRLVFSLSRLTDRQADAELIGYTSYREQETTTEGVRVAFGVPAVRFGTSYFPYSTLGENFDFVKLPGMDREGFWPLAADTVLRWREFADDIRRDLRLAKAMGFHVIRLHHLELLAPIPPETRQAYLDFFFGELRHLQLKAMLDVFASDTAIAELLDRYGDVVEAVELENEILIWGIPADRPARWRQTYATIKRVAPQVRVHLTGYNNTGIFNRLIALGVPFDRVGLHLYVDSLDAIPTTRGYALALGSYAGKIGRPPVITEWNWRDLTRLTPEARAEVYPAIFETVLATRAVPEMFQFQFNETLAPNPRSGRGNLLRHYELLHLSRRLKPEALELMKLIRRYSAPDDPVRRLCLPPVVVNLDARGTGMATVALTNTSPHSIRLKVSLETSGDLQADLTDARKDMLEPGQACSVPVALKTVGLTPGFYYCFLRCESDEGWLRYGWIEARLAGAPQLDESPRLAVAYPRGIREALDFDWAAPLAVVYGQDAPVLEVETAIALAETLESATGHPVDYWQADTLPAEQWAARPLILVGSRNHLPLAADLVEKLAPDATSFVTRLSLPATPPRLVVSGADPRAVEQAGMDLLLRWWRHAKDAAARRVGLVEKELPRGSDPAQLP